FDKHTTDREIAVVGGALADPDFTGGGDRVHFSVAVGGAPGPLRIEAELWYQPIGYRWAHNLRLYSAVAEPARFIHYFDALSTGSAPILPVASPPDGRPTPLCTRPLKRASSRIAS